MQLTDSQKNKIITLYKLGSSIVEISSKLNINRKTISLWIRRYNETGETKKIYVRERITNKLTLNQIFKIIEVIETKNYSIEQIIKELDLAISESTIRNILKQIKYRYGNNKKKPLLTDKQKINRIEWCKMHKMFNWYFVEFSDEMTIWKDKNSNKCWYKIGKQKIKYKNSHSIKLNVWGMINSEGEFFYFIFKENMNSDFYENILYTNLIPLHRENYYFQQDNNKSHTTENIKNFFKDCDINLLPWPSNSPDLNLIENIWHCVKNKMGKIINLTNDNFEKNLIICLDSIDKETIINLYKSMDNRINEVILNNGNPINY
jgi:transposase